MRKIVCFLMALCFLPFFAACDVTKDSSLKDISRPYTGEYFCKKLTIGGEDALQNFRFITLDLKGDGEFELRYQTESGGEGSYGGQYRISEEQGEISFTANHLLRSVTRSFSYEKGKIEIRLNFGGRLYYAEFSYPK